MCVTCLITACVCMSVHLCVCMHTVCVSIPIYVCTYVCKWMCFVSSQDCISSLCCDTNCAVTMFECTVLELMLHFLLMVAGVSLY